MLRTVEQSTMRKVYLRILPFAVLTYFFCYLDRINVGFASLTMNKDIGLDAAWYGMAAGAFFWGYVLFEVPSNIILEKVGARIWIARIMITWGIISGCTAFATGPYSFMAIRFLLGLAEAGLFPGFVPYYRGRDGHYWPPPAQIRACAANALGSYLECLTLNRWFGHGCSTRGDGRNRLISRTIRSHVSRCRWLRRRRLRNQMMLV